MPTAPTVSRAPSPAVRIKDPLASFALHRGYSSRIRSVLCRNPHTAEAGVRMNACARRLGVLLEERPGDQLKAHLEDARLCQLRACPFCEWRKVRAWRARILKACEEVRTDYPKMRPLMLTLTVKNCPVDELSHTLDRMNNAWRLLSRRRWFPSDLWFRRTEVSLGRPSDGPGDVPAPPSEDGDDGHLENDPTALSAALTGGVGGVNGGRLWAHPHFHVLMWVRPSYWGRDYIKQRDWATYWAEALHADYLPVIDVRKAYADRGGREPEVPDVDAACEAAKYITKATDMLALGDELPDFLDQLRGRRMVAVSRRLRQYMKAEDISEAELMDPCPVLDRKAEWAYAIAQWVEDTSTYQLIP